jgi:hypothetical protein
MRHRIDSASRMKERNPRQRWAFSAGVSDAGVVGAVSAMAAW